MKFIALFSLLSVAFAAPGLLGTKECTYGPSYWCSHISRAQKCRAVQHCMATVWKNQIIKPKDTQECKACKEVVEIARKMLKNNQTKDAIEKYLPLACSLIYTGDAAEKCKKEVAEYLPIILDLITSGTPAETICATVKLCTGLEDTVPQHEVKTHDVTEKSDQMCQDCTNFFTDVQSVITSNETVQQFVNEFEQTVCAQLGPLVGVCDFLVEEYIPQLLTFLADAVNPSTTCRVIGFCNENVDLVTVTKVKMELKNMLKEFIKKKTVAGQEECDACKSIMTDLQALVRDPTAQGKVTDFVKTFICGKLSGLTQDCDNLVDTYAPIAFGLLANELDPETSCIFVGLCTNSAVKKQPMKALSLLPATSIKPLKASGDVECDICKTVMTALNAVVTAKSTEAEIKKALEDICSRLPASDATQCTEFVNQFLPQILELIRDELVPKAFCLKVKACTAVKSQPKIKVMKKANDELCVVCELAMNYIDQYLSKNVTERELQKYLENICNVLPKTIKDECDAFVQQYADAVIELLLQKLPPKLVCTKLGLCNSTVEDLPKPAVTGILLRGEPIVNQKIKVTKKANDEKCEICEIAVNYVDTFLSKNATDEEIKKALNEICAKLPGALPSQCTAFVDEYLSSILILLKQKLDPKIVCVKLGICTARKSQIKINPTKKANGPQCVICEYVLSQLESQLKKNATQEAVEKALEKVCSLMPSTIKGECDDFVTQYSSVIIPLLVQAVDPKRVCSLLGLCNSTLEVLPKPAVTGILLRGEPIINQQMKTTKNTNDNCEMCKLVMTELQNVLKDKATEADIEAVLDKVCQVLPSDLKNNCDDFVKEYSPMIVQMLLQLSPEEVCSKIGLCTSKVVPKPAVTGLLLTGEPIVNQKTPVKNDDECLACKIVMNYLSEALKENETVVLLKALMEKACSYLPESVAGECQGIVIAFGNMIIQEIENELDPKAICTYFGVCPNASKEEIKTSIKEVLKNAMTESGKTQDSKLYFKSTKRLGQRKCSYGPSYWCASLSKARRCGMEEHCMKHVWSRNIKI